jgi:hypothetical protein
MSLASARFPGFRGSWEFTGAWCEALSSAVPAESKPQQRRLRKLEAVSAFIDQVLTGDLQAPPKQRHTARRIWQRLCAEVPGVNVGERSVRGYVRRRRQQLGLLQREVFVPQSYDWGIEGQEDWYDGWAVLGRREDQAPGLRDAFDGQRRSLSPGLHARHPTGVSGSARARLPLF